MSEIAAKLAERRGRIAAMQRPSKRLRRRRRQRLGRRDDSSRETPQTSFSL